jgi:glycosyltransferase involved in cell wall biosynthesis
MRTTDRERAGCPASSEARDDRLDECVASDSAHNVIVYFSSVPSVISTTMEDGSTIRGDSGQSGAPADIPAMPRVSIGLPVFNGERWLAESVDSLLSQTFSDFELIICDNASTDSTEEIGRRYAQQDPRVRYMRNVSNIGGMRNANLTFELARGEYFRWAASDDRAAPTLLERLVHELDTRPDVVAAVSPSIAIDHRGERLPYFYVGKAEGKLLSRGRNDPPLMTDASGVRYPTEGTAGRPSRRFRELMLTRGPCEASYGLIRSDVLRRTRVHQPYTCSDVVMLGELALHGPFFIIDEPLFFKRWHASNHCKERGPGRMVWSRPDLAVSGQTTLPHWLQLWGWISAILRAKHLPFSERVRCGASTIRFIKSDCKALAWDVGSAAVMTMHSREWRRRCYAAENWTLAEEPTSSTAV